jgi:hypothetical protein
VEKSKDGTFPLRLEIPQPRRDSHFSHRLGRDVNLSISSRQEE